MKNKNKAVITAVCAFATVAASVFGTMAYFTSQTEPVNNTFTVGNVAITLDELDVDNDERTDDNVTVDGVTRDKQNKYKLIPGGTYTKDPTIHVLSTSENCWLYVQVQNDLTAIESNSFEHVDPITKQKIEYGNIDTQMTSGGWKKIADVDGTSIYAYQTLTEKNTDVVVFKAFGIAGDKVTNITKNGALESSDANDSSDLAYYDNNGKVISVTAFAIQAQGFNTPEAAWAISGNTLLEAAKNNQNT